MTLPDLLHQVQGLTTTGFTLLEIRDRDERVMSRFELKLLTADRPIGPIRL